MWGNVTLGRLMPLLLPSENGPTIFFDPDISISNPEESSQIADDPKPWKRFGIIFRAANGWWGNRNLENKGQRLAESMYRRISIVQLNAICLRSTMEASL